MIIGIETTKAFEKEKTGVGWYCYYIVKEIAEIIDGDVELRLYVNPHAQISKSESLISKQILNSKFQIPNKQQSDNIKIKQLSWFLQKLWTQGRLSLEMIINPPDVLFIPAHLPPLIHPKKLVVTVHDLAFKQYPEVYSKKELRLQEWGIKRVLKRAWRIITPSEFTKSEIQKYYPRLAKDNIFVVPHGIEKSQNSPPKADPPLAENLKSQNHNLKLKTNIIYIGRVEHKKNIVNLVKAFNILKNWKLEIGNWKLVLIGPQGYGYGTIKKEIAASPRKNDIHELGWLDQEATKEHLTSAALLVFPSLYEGFGLPILEAMSSGVPIVCSDIPAHKEVGGEAAHYFNPNDPEDIAEKMRAMLENETTRQKTIERGEARARNFSWRNAAEKTFAILTEGVS